MFAASKSGSADAKDPQFNYVTMLLHGNGTNGAQNNTFTDSSTNNFTITRNGNTTQGTFSPYGSNWSNSFATNSAIRYPYTSSLTSWWTQNFTIEMWVFNNTNAVSGTNSLPLQFAHGVYNSTPTYWAFGTNASGQLNFYYYNGSANNVTSTTTAALGTWNHIAMVYTHSSGNISLYLNGVSVASATKSGTPQNDNTNTVNIGAVQSTYYNGYISNLRVLNGTALYSGSFTPSTTPLTAITNTQLLTCADNRFVDDSTNNATPTIIGSPSVQRFSPFKATSAYTTSVIGGSGYFDGSGDYLSLSNVSALQPGTSTNPFCIECWVYPTSIPSSNLAILGNYTVVSYPTNTNGFDIITNSSNQVTFRWGYPNYADAGNSSAMPLNTWNHIVVCRNSSGSMSCYLNGTRWFNTSSNTSITTATASSFWVGWAGSLSGTTINPFAGYISNTRFVNGSAVYDPTVSTLTVPTAPLTAITNTSLLLSNTNAGILDNAMMNDLETVGNAQISTSVKKYGTGSLAFDGSGDYLLSPDSPNTEFGSGDFTVELWAYYSSTSGTPALIDKRASTAGYSPFIFYTTGGTLVFYSSSNGSSYDIANGVTIGSVTTGTWYHVAVSRSGSSIRLFLNGTLANTITSSAALVNNSDAWSIGGTVGGNYLNGYIDDLRITKGYARYTATFTPPTAPFPDKG